MTQETKTASPSKSSEQANPNGVASNQQGPNLNQGDQEGLSPSTDAEDSGLIEKPSNAWKHGAYAKTVVLDSESMENFAALHENLREHYDPVGDLEEQLIADVANAIWRKRRLDRQYREICSSHGPSQGTSANSQGLTFPKPGLRDMFLKLGRKLAEADGIDYGDPDVPTSTKSPSMQMLWDLLQQMSTPKDSTETTFDRVTGASDLERYLKLVASLDKLIEKKLAALARSKLFRQEFAPKLLPAHGLNNDGGSAGKEVSSPRGEPSSKLN